MRANTAALTALPNFSVQTNRQGEKWAKLAFSSVRACHEAGRQHARTANELQWLDSGHWLGLGEQSVADFEQTGIAQDCLKLVQQSNAALTKSFTRMANPHAAMTGGYWDTPSVLAGLPLAARTRKRAKLPPRDIKLAFFISAGMRAEAMARLTAKVSRAIWDYTLAGGAVNFTVADVATVRASPYTGVIVEMKVGTSDVAELALGFSPTMSRALGGPLQAALSHANFDSLNSPRVCPLPGYLWCGGKMEEATANINAAIKLLQISE